jgi:hypothetical protein
VLEHTCKGSGYATSSFFGVIDTTGFNGVQLTAADAEDVLNVNGVSSVPEPSAWAMMLLGFAGLGFLGFRRSRQPVAISL